MLKIYGVLAHHPYPLNDILAEQRVISLGTVGGKF